VSEANVTVSHWAIDNAGHTIETYNLPSVIRDEHIIDTIPRLSLSSLVFVHHADDFRSYKKKFVYGMEDVFSTRDDVNLWLPAQSLSVILYESIMSLYGELQRVLNHRREHQEVFSSFSQYISILTWYYLIEKLRLPIIIKKKVVTYLVPSERDLPMTKVKAYQNCHILRIETAASISCLMAVFGLCAVVGVRKKLPTLSKRLRTGQGFVSARVGIQLLDVINLVDTSNNGEIPEIRAQFTFNAYGRKGIDLIYIPDQSCIRICVRYKKFVLQDALVLLQQLGVSTISRDNAPVAGSISDDDLERLLRG